MFTARLPSVAAISSSMRFQVNAPLISSNEFAPSFRQALLVAVIFSVSGGLAWVGFGTVARPLFMTCAIIAAWYYHGRSPWLYLTLTFWFWTLTPFIRRVIDYRAGFDSMNIILVTPNVMTLCMVQDLLRSRELMRRPETLIGLMLFLPALYGLMVNLVQGQIVPGAVAAADWLVPLFYFFFLIDKAASVGEAEAHLSGFITINSIVVVGYGLNQFWNPPIWDVEWALSSHMLGTTQARAEAFHIFGTLNSQGIMADWLGALILLSLHFRSRLTPFLLPATVVLLLMTYVRSVTVSVLIGLIVATLLGGGRMVSGLSRLAVAVIFVVIVLASLDTNIADALFSRFSSLSEIQNDDSALQRTSIWSAAPALIDSHPWGMGIGALGRGAVASGNADLVSVDAGPLAIYLCLGWVAGTIYLLGMVAVIGQAAIAATRLRSPVVVAFVAAAICSFAELPFVNIYGFAGSVLWLCGGFAIAYGMHAQTAGCSGTAGTTHSGTTMHEEGTVGQKHRQYEPHRGSGGTQHHQIKHQE